MKSRFLQAIGFGSILLLVSGGLLIYSALKHSINAQRADLLAAAARYPKFTLEQRMSVSRARQFELHPTWKDLSLAQAAQRLIRQATRVASSTQAQFANFLGNTTSINSPAGTVLALVRQTNCSLTLLSGPYTLNFTNPGYTFNSTTPSYEQTLHAGAHLTTTADQFSGGCPDPTLGQSDHRAVFAGKTSSGLYVFGAYVYNAAASDNEVYSMIAGSSYAYQSSTKLPTQGLPIGMLTADLNQDGTGDLLSINNPLSLSGAPAVSIFLGNPDGTFKPATFAALPGNNLLSAVIDDFNNDGKSDIVVATETLASNGGTSAYQISFLAGNGDGTFKATQSSTVVPPAGANNPYAGLTSGSVRGNGNKDLVSPSGILLLGNGDGTFTQSAALAFPSSMATSSFGPNLVLADFNKDGKLDVAVGNGQTINTFNGNGDGTFTVGSAYASINNVGYLYATDLDGDGNIDLYSGFANGGVFAGDQFLLNQTYALMGNGDGTFQGAPATPFLFTGTNLADLNADGKLDGVGVNAALNSANVSFTSYLGNGGGAFTNQSTLAVSPLTIQGDSYTLTGIDSFGLGDFNGDGHVDLIYFPQGLVAPKGQTGYFLAAGDGAGAFQAPAFVPAPSFAPAADDYGESLSNVFVADFNHDGKPDIIYNYIDESYNSQTYYQGIAVQLGNGDGTFKAPQTIQTYSSTTSPTSAPPSVVQIGDVNQDGNPDIFTLIINTVGTTTTTQLQLYLGKGDGTFGAPSTPPAADQINPPSFGSQLGQIVLADINGDGHSDLVTLGSTTTGNLAEVAVSLGNGDGTFAAPKILDFGGGSSLGYGLAVADFDGDGKLDVFVGGFNPPIDTGIFLGNGDGTFQSFTGATGAVQPVQAVDLLVWGAALASDFNGDGKPDLLAGDAVLLNEGLSSTATGPTASTTALSASATSIAPGAALTLTATVSGATGAAAPTGTVTFLDGTAQLGTATLASGVATSATSSLAVGAHTITASYAGDANNAPSVSSAVTVTVVAPPPSFTLSLNPASGSVAATGTTTSVLSITPMNGFAQAVSFACSGLPVQATCAFAPATVTPANAAVTTTMTITTGAVASLSSGKFPFAFAGGVLGLVLLGSRRRMRSRLLSCIALGLLVLGIGSCGGGSGGGGSKATTGTPAGTSTVTVTATSGSLTQTSTYTLTVQ